MASAVATIGGAGAAAGAGIGGLAGAGGGSLVAPGVGTVGGAYGGAAAGGAAGYVAGGGLGFITGYMFCSTGNGDEGGGKTTGHGAERMEERGATEAEIQEVKTGQQYIQDDGAIAYVKKLASGRYNILIEGEGGTVTWLKNKTASEVKGLARNYGWQ